MLLPLLGALGLFSAAAVAEVVSSAKATLRDEILGTKNWNELEALVQQKTGKLPMELITVMDAPTEIMEALDDDVLHHVVRLAVQGGVMTPEMAHMVMPKATFGAFQR